jgi:hypothetical protein
MSCVFCSITFLIGDGPSDHSPNVSPLAVLELVGFAHFEAEGNGTKINSTKLALPMKFRNHGAVNLHAREVAIYLIQERSPSAREHVFPAEVLHGMGCDDHGGLSGDKVDEATQPLGMGHHLRIDIFVVAFEERSGCINNYECKGAVLSLAFMI